MSCYNSNNPVLQWSLMLCSTSSELLVVKQVTPFLREVSVIFRIKERVFFFLIFPEKEGHCVCELECKEAFWATSLPVLVPRGCSALSPLGLGLHYHTRRVGWGIPSGYVTRSSAAQDWGPSLGFSKTSCFKASPQTGKWEREEIVSLCPVSGRRREDFHLLESNF